MQIRLVQRHRLELMDDDETKYQYTVDATDI